MPREQINIKKRIAIADLRPGMYVVGLDRSWLNTPFLFHRKLIQRVDEIEQLKKHGIGEVVIDTSRGADVAVMADENSSSVEEGSKSAADTLQPDAANSPKPSWRWRMWSRGYLLNRASVQLPGTQIGPNVIIRLSHHLVNAVGVSQVMSTEHFDSDRCSVRADDSDCVFRAKSAPIPLAK